MNRTTLPFVLLLLLMAPAAHAEDQPAPPDAKGPTGIPRPIEMLGTELQVTPPAGKDWKVHADATTPGQWAVSYSRGDVVLQAMVVPRNASTPKDARRLLFAALQGLRRIIALDGAIGMPWVKEHRVMGYRGADGTLSTRRDGRMQTGRARVLYAGDHWGFVWGIHPTGIPEADRTVVKSFVESLAPAMPAFFRPVFFDAKTQDDVLYQPTNEAPILRKHVVAMERMVEMAAEGAMTLSRRAQLREVILADAAREDAVKFRNGLRDMPKVFEHHADLSEAEQRAKQAELGTAIYHGYLSRYLKQEPIGLAFVHTWNESRMTLASGKHGKFTVLLLRRDVDNLLEMAGFLASLAADQPRAVSVDQRAAFAESCAASWPTLPLEVRKAWKAAGATWLRLRYTWDHAEVAQRLAFRRAVLGAFATPEQQAEILAAKGPKALKAWIDANGPLDTMQIVRSYAAMTVAERDAIVNVLGERPKTVPLGW